MEVPLQITFRDMEPSPWVEDRVREEVRKLEQFYDRITSCRVVVEMPHRHHLRGNQIRAHIELDVPGSVLVVDHEPSLHHTLSQAGATHWEKHCEAHPEHKDAFLAIHQSFGQARRQLQDYVRKLRGDVKLHCRIPPGRRDKLSVEPAESTSETEKL